MRCSRSVFRRVSSSAARMLLLGLAWAGAPAWAAVDFGRDVLPILSDNCFHCHGPDEKARKAKLRLDTPEGAFRTHDGVTVVTPGDTAKSELIRRIFTADADDVMPPPYSHRTLSPAQKDTLKRWVSEGAKWGKHWAFVPPKRSEVPVVQNSKSKIQNAIDAFVVTRLEAEGLTPSPEADRERLIRRVTFDLTGLPPTPSEIDAFLKDAVPEAYERVVNRLLASPRYGERLASDWLDVARYADTHGYQADRSRSMWPYRDWVIKAFNQNLPFDQFVTWQLAGDLLPNATKEQRLATAFNRLHMQNEEGGIVEEEFRVAYVVDRVNTFGTAFLGLTLECSRCHDHKFDPISMRDYYSLFSFFQNIDESGQTVYFGEVMPVPTLLLSTPEQDATLAELRRNIAASEQTLEQTRAEARKHFQQWLQARSRHGPGVALRGLVGQFAFDAIHTNRTAKGESRQIFNQATGTNHARLQEDPVLVPGVFGQAAELNGENGFTFPGVGRFSRADPFTIGLWLRTPSHAPRLLVLHKSRAWMDAGSRGYELVLEEGHVSVGLHHMWPGNAIKVRSRLQLPTNDWVHVAFTYDGSSRAAGLTLYVNGLPAEREVIRDGLWKDFTYGGDEPELAIGYRFRDSGFKGGRVDELKVFDCALTALEVAHVAGRADLLAALDPPATELTKGQREGLFDWWFTNVHTPATNQVAALTALRRRQSQFIEPIPEAMVMQEMAQPKPAFVFKRGAYDAPGDRVSADTPKALPPLADGAPRHRLGLAQWLLAPDHPLLARVTVNRAWQQCFGKGLVETSDNFGSQGSPPTHPELLDWLARDFVDTGWDMKRLLKLIVMSATYRQSSHASAELLARDPANQLLARGPVKRLTAEMLRDQALAASGLLVEKIGGPSVKPYQPPGLWEIAMGNPKYDQGKGDALHRRSLYTYWKRTVPPPAMMTFDAADRSNCSVRRQSTSTPLQALALLNDVQMVEAARHVAQRMLREGGGSTGDQVTWAFRMVTSRQPTPREANVLTQLLSEQRDLFASDPVAAKKLLAVGEASCDAALNEVDLAAGTVLAKALLNHDEAILRR